MIAYASNTGTKRNLKVMRDAGWRILLTPSNCRLPERMRFAIDNGAWSAFQQGTEFDGDKFCQLVEKYGAAADFVVVPDIVAGGMESLQFSLGWLSKGPLKHLVNLLLPVQDGMDVSAVGKVLRRYPYIGLFLGGSTEWKLRTMYGWGMVAASLARYYHVGRVNTVRRIRLCAEAGVASFDGTSVSKFSCNLPMLENARQQPSLITPMVCGTDWHPRQFV
jgi:hypothetical protein